MMHASFILANTLPFLGNMVGLLIAAAVLAYVCSRLRIVPIVGFLLAGVVVGPHGAGMIKDDHLIGALAEIGVILLLFTIGIEFSLDRLAAMKTVIFVGGSAQVLVTAGLVALVLLPFGVDWRSGVFTGCLVALSSTAIVLKILGDRHETHTPAGEATVGILLSQDLAVIVMVMMIPMLAGAGGGIAAIGWNLAKAGILIALVLVGARRVMPWILEIIARTCSAEIFLLSVIAVCLGTAYLSSLAGVSLALGAFLAGLVVSESKFRHHAVSEIMPLQILFSATFFVSVGLLLDLRFIAMHPFLVVGLVLGIAVVKFLGGAASVLLLRRPIAVAAWCGFLLAQVGEFSFVLQRSAAESGLFPGGSRNAGPPAFIAASVLLMLLTPVMAVAGARVNKRLGRRAEAATAGPSPTSPVAPPVPATAPSTPADNEVDGSENHVILDGYGGVAKLLVPILQSANVPFVVITLSPEGAAKLDEAKVSVVRGSTSRLAALEQAGVRSARMVVIADDDAETTERAVAVSLQTHPTLQVIARASDEHTAVRLKDAGAKTVVCDTHTSAAEILRKILRAYDISYEEIEAYTERLDPLPKTAPLETFGAPKVTCSHGDQIKDPPARTPDGCEECLKLGDTWLHLRLCRTCGHVGCCDDSKNKHATAHFHKTTHPVVKSLERGEDWSWCYVDEKYV